MARLCVLIIAVLLAQVSWAQPDGDRSSGPKTVIGPRNPDLQRGSQLLLAGKADQGVELTLQGLKVAQGAREEEAALSNLCAGYIMLEQYDEALKYCELLLARNEKSWRGYNNRAVIYIATEQYAKAHRDLVRAEELNPGAQTIRVARAIYLDAVNPVAPQVEIDDRQPGYDDEVEQN
jgi:tetratricopeptide (TPR) repeat protein